MHDNELTTILWRGKWLILATVAVAAALADVHRWVDQNST